METQCRRVEFFLPHGTGLFVRCRLFKKSGSWSLPQEAIMLQLVVHVIKSYSQSDFAGAV